MVDEIRNDARGSTSGSRQALPSGRVDDASRDAYRIWFHSDDHLRTLSADDLVELIVDDEDRVPRRVIDECVSRGDAMLDALEHVLDTGMSWSDDTIEGYWWLTLHTIHILGLIPGLRAGAMLTRAMIRLRQDEDDDALCDWLGGCWPALFRNKPDEVLRPMHAMVANRDFNPYLRSDLLDVLTAAGVRTSADALEGQLDVAAEMAANENEDESFRELAMLLLLDFPRQRHRALLEGYALSPHGQASGVIKPDDVSAVFAAARDQPEWDSFSDPWVFYEPERIAMRQTLWAQEEDGEPLGVSVIEDFEDLQALVRGNGDHKLDLLPFARASGADEPCPCGSGKQYTKCCLGLEDDPD